jgi:hypothetical protein
MLLSAETRELLRIAALQGTTSASPSWRLCSTGGPVTELLGRVWEAIEGGVLAALPDRSAFRRCASWSSWNWRIWTM